MTIFLTIDQSTSATKALLFDERGGLLDAESLPHQQIYPAPGWVEHNAEEIYTNTLQTVKTLLERRAVEAGQAVCLSLTNQRETFVVFDKESGAPLANAIVWQCRRGEALCRELIEAGHGPKVQELTGLKIDTYFPASKIKWLLDARPELCRMLENGKALLGTIDTYLIYRMTKSMVFATDYTNASRTLLYDIGGLRWSEELCRLFGVPRQSLAEVRESSDTYGETDLGGILPKSLPICGVMGDSQAALFAQRCFTPGSAKVTFGTGSSVLLNIGSNLVHSSRGIVSTIGWVHNRKPTYAFEGIINYTGATIAWLRDQAGMIQSSAESETLAESVEDNGGVYLVPAFVGLSAPYWRPDARAAILGLTPSSTRAHIVRAGLESIAYIVNDVLESMGKEAGVSLQHVYADGGAIRNRFLMQFTADISGLSLRASDLPELSAFGAALSGALGLGVYASLKDLEHLPIGYSTYTPQMDRERAKALIQGWQGAVRQVLVSHD